MGEILECPHCNIYIEICPAEKCHYEDHEEYRCPKCLKAFEVFAETTVAYSVTRKIEEDN